MLLQNKGCASNMKEILLHFTVKVAFHVFFRAFVIYVNVLFKKCYVVSVCVVLLVSSASMFVWLRLHPGLTGNRAFPQWADALFSR